jgi:hypothetical protein
MSDSNPFAKYVWGGILLYCVGFWVVLGLALAGL